MDDELLEVVNERGEAIGRARRKEVHADPSLIHRVVHVLVFNRRGELLLQKRSLAKDVAPGKWDTSVGGHVSPGEDTESAARREMEEELGITLAALSFLYRYLFTDERESELVTTYACCHEGPFPFNGSEIDEVRFWGTDDIEGRLGSGTFSGHFEKEFAAYRASGTQTPRSAGP